MRKGLLAVGLMGAMVLVSCTSSEPLRNTAASKPADPCVLTEPIFAAEPQDVDGKPVDPGSTSPKPWYFSPDRAIRMYALPLWVGRNKIAWFRPDGAEIQVSGRRLDAPAPPMEVDIGSRMPHQFCLSILIFPTEGCWEIVGKSGNSELRAVVKVSPRP